MAEEKSFHKSSENCSEIVPQEAQHYDNYT